MPSDDAMPWILGGGAAAAVAAYYWHRSREADKTRSAAGDNPAPSGASSEGATSKSSQSTQPVEPLPGRWVWPVGVWKGRKPVISSGFGTPRRLPSGEVIPHAGVDIMYRRQPGDPWKPGTPNGTKHFVMPDYRAVLAASDGVVWSAAKTPRGWTVVIDHAPHKLATYYTHMSSLLVTAKQPVKAGTPIGIIGADPLDPAQVMHPHVEVWRGARETHFDPQRLMETTWEYLPDPGDLPRAVVARNGGHRPKDATEYSVPVLSHYRRPRR